MKIAFFTNNYKPFVGGVPIAIENLARKLRQHSHRVFIFAPDYGENTSDETDIIRTPALRNFNDTHFALPIPFSVEPYVRFSDLAPDVVHVHHPFLLGETGLHAARTHELPVVFTYHTQYEKYAHYLPFGEQMVGEVAINLSSRFANACDAIIAPSSDVKATLEQRGVTTPIRVIPTGVDLQQFRGGERGALRAELGLTQANRVLLFVSRLAKEKNVGFLLDAFERLAKRDDLLHFALVGAGDDEQALRERASQMNCGDRLHFLGMRSGKDLVSAYRGADIFVFASTTETQGMVVIEAMAAGLPVVAVDAPGVRDVVTDGATGFLVKEGDVEAFTERVRRILDDRGLTHHLLEGARERARELSLSNTTRKVEQLYRYVMKNPHPDRQERFLLLREFFRYQFDKLAEGIQALIP